MEDFDLAIPWNVVTLYVKSLVIVIREPMGRKGMRKYDFSDELSSIPVEVHFVPFHQGSVLGGMQHVKVP